LLAWSRRRKGGVKIARALGRLPTLQRRRVGTVRWSSSFVQDRLCLARPKARRSTTFSCSIPGGVLGFVNFLQRCHHHRGISAGLSRLQKLLFEYQWRRQVRRVIARDILGLKEKGRRITRPSGLEPQQQAYLVDTARIAACYFSKVIILHIAARGIQVCPVERIERFQTEISRHALCDPESLTD
jgi:hypothetical protein